MSKIKAVYAKKDEVPGEFLSLFTEKDGRWELTEVEGLKTEGDVARLQEALRKERKDHGDAKKALEAAAEKAEQFDALEEEVSELRLWKDTQGKDLDEKVNKLVDAKIAGRVGPLERDLKKQTDLAARLQKERDGLAGELKNKTVRDAVMKVLVDDKVDPLAYEDALMNAERIFEVQDDGASVLTKDGVNPKDWLADMKGKRLWWPQSQGGGAGGGNGGGSGNPADNPWMAGPNWNMTKQGEVMMSNPALATKMQEAAKDAAARAAAGRGA